MKKAIILPILIRDFVKRGNSEFAGQLDNFSNVLNSVTGPTALAIKYGFTTAELEEIENDAAYFRFWQTKHTSGVTYSKSWAEKGRQLRGGEGTSSSAWPVGADVSAPPVEVLPGIERRFREMARKAKSQSRIYSEGDGVSMGIETNSRAFVPKDGTPDLKIKVASAGHPVIGYIKSKYVGINIYKDAGDGRGFMFLATCNEVSFVDLSALPANGISAAWTYKATYIFDGKEVGTISKNVTITVLGV